MEILDDDVFVLNDEHKAWAFGDEPFKVFAVKQSDGAEGRMYIGAMSEAALKNLRKFWKEYVIWYKRIY